MPCCVVDSSVYVSVLVRDEQYGRAREFLSMNAGRLATVSIAYVEVANAVWKHVHVLRRIPVDRYEKLSRAIKSVIEASTPNIYEARELLLDALKVAGEYGVTVYDALFIALALKLGVRLATFDEKLINVLSQQGLSLAFKP